MPVTPITTENLLLRYGYWTGGGYSAGVASPSFVPYAQWQLNISIVPVFDDFDAQSRLHDIAWAEAQNLLIDQLHDGQSIQAALINYHNAIRVADLAFLSGVSGIEADLLWGERVRGSGIEAMELSAEQHAALANSTNYRDAMAALGLGNLNDVFAAREAFKAYVNNHPGDTSSPQYLALLEAYQDELAENPLLSTLGDKGQMAAKAIEANTGLIPQFVGGATDWALFQFGEVVESAIELFTGNNTQINLGGASYLIREVVTSVSEVTTAVAEFISEQAGVGTAWFTSVNSQTVVSSWLANNIGDLLEGNITAEEALIGLAREYGAQYLSGFVGALVTDATKAKEVLSQVFQEGFDVNAGLADQYAASIEGAIGRMIVEFALSDFDAQQAINAGAGYLASQITATYLHESGLITTGTAASSAASAGAATAIIGLINSGDYDSSDWIMLGVQVGIAASSAAAGSAIAAALSFAPAGGPAAVITAVIAFLASKIVGSIYRGAVFYEGEGRTPAEVFASIYQVQTIIVDGQPVTALVAVNTNGSTVIASGNIGYLIGNAGSDVLVGTNAVQTITANGGADYLEARGGNDNLLGGTGNDHLNGGDGNDVLQGDAGDDIVFAEAGNDTAIGGTDNDFIHLGTGDDIAAGGAGHDYLIGGGGDDALAGEAGNDSIDGGYGNDSIAGGDGDDLILGNLGNDAINGENGSDTIFGDDGMDQIFGSDGNDFIDGGADIDMLYGDNGADLIVAGSGDDFAEGGLGNDNILGGTGNDVMLGGMDDDYLRGDEGDDTISGGYGADILIGGVGSNALDGGDGSDIYVIGADAAEHHNTIIDEGAAGDTDTLLLSWLSQANAQAGLSLVRDEDDLIISYNGRVLTTVTNQFVAGQGIERIELAPGNYINLTNVTYHPATHIGTFAIATTLAAGVAATVEAREALVEENLLGKQLYWNETFLDKLSQLAYDEQLSEQTVYTYYNGTEIESFKRARGKFGGHYTVYKLDMPGDINGTEFVRLEYVILDAEDQAAAAGFGNNEASMAGPYEHFENGAQVIYSTFGGKNIQDIVLNGTVLSTKVAGETTLYQAGTTVYGATYAQRAAAGTSATTDIAVKRFGSDLLVGAYWDETIDGKSGDDVLVGNDGNDNLIGADGNDWGFGGDGNDTLTGGNGDDILFGGDGNDVISGGAHNDAIIGSGGNDSIHGDSGDDWIDGGDDNDTINAGDGNDNLIGGNGNDSLIGGNGSDILLGGDGDDALYGGEGNDTLIGGFGNDSLYGGGGDDVLNGDGGALLLDGGDGNDTIVFSVSNAGIVANLHLGTFTGGSASTSTIYNFENVTGSTYGDTIYGGINSSIIDGAGGIDTLSYIYSTAAVNINLSTSSFVGGFAQGDVVSNVERILGSDFGDSLVGGAGSTAIYGGEGNDTITAYAGNDWLNGGEGNDILYGIQGANTIEGGAGDDIIISGTGADYIDGGEGLNDQVSYSSSATAVFINLETFAFTGGDASGDYLTGIEHVIGTWVSDSIVGNASGNIIQTGSGNDTILGGGGNDTLVGGAGADSINGGDGADLTSYNGSGSAVNLNLTTGLFTGGDATGDVLINIENLQGTDFNDTLVGNAFDNLLIGAAGHDAVDGKTGNDTVYAGMGNDTVLGGAGTDLLFGDEGNDSLDGGGDNDTIYAWDGNDTLQGGDGEDLLIGDAGDDSLDGGSGRDTMYGGVGHDSMRGGLNADIILGDDGNDSLFGEDGNDSLYGYKGNDYLDGGGGDDELAGEEGDDIIYGGAGNDVIYTDIVLSDTLFGYGADNASGGNGNDLIRAGRGNDTIDGGAGNDSLYGDEGDDIITDVAGNNLINVGDGNDSVIGGTGKDTILGYAGNDTIYGGGERDQLYGLSGNDQIFAGIDNDTIYGDTGDDALFGEDGDDLLDGWHGIDSISGGLGNDTISGGDGNDSLSGGDGDDIIYGDRQLLPNALPVNPEDVLAMIDNKPSYDTWGLLYQGTQYTLSALQAAPHEMLIINPAQYSLTSIPESEVLWTESDITSIKTGGSEKMVLGYVNTAKINSFWTQWDASWTDNGLANGALTTAGSTVSWLGNVDGNYIATREANYWDTDWQQIVFERIGMMVDQGFDGTLLDDVSEFFERRVEGLTPGSQAFIDQVSENAIAMRNFVLAIRAYADVVMAARLGIAVGDLTDTTRFQLYVNGAPYLLQDALMADDPDPAVNIQAVLNDAASLNYLNAIDGMLVENFFSRGDSTAAYVDYTSALYSDFGIPILSLDTDQVTQQQRMQIITDAINHGFMPYTTESAAYDVLNGTFFAELVDDTPSDYNDAIEGGDGNDTIIGGLGADTIQGGGGNDTASYITSAAAVTISLIASSAAGGAAEGDVLSGVESLLGSNHDDILTGDAFANILAGADGSDTLNGDIGNDTLHGGVGNDVLDGGIGADVLDGGDGFDIVSYASTFSAVQINLQTGVYSGAAEGDVFSNIEGVTGSISADSIVGDDGANILDGYFGVDTIEGGEGNDTITGGAGNDIFRFSGVFGNDVITDFTIGSDTIDLSGYAGLNIADLNIVQIMGIGTRDGFIPGGVSITLPNGSNIFLQGLSRQEVLNNLQAIFTGLGGNTSGGATEGNDTLSGTAGNDYIDGLAGDDIINSLDGSDTLIGGLGNDTITDFSIGQDLIDLSSYLNLEFQDLKITSELNNTVIILPNGSEIRLIGISPEDVTAGIFTGLAQDGKSTEENDDSGAITIDTSIDTAYTLMAVDEDDDIVVDDSFAGAGYDSTETSVWEDSTFSLEDESPVQNGAGEIEGFDVNLAIIDHTASLQSDLIH